MMLLSRFWYAILGLLLGVALYVVYLAVGQYNRRNHVAMAETLASDSQTVGWALQIDARRRLDALLLGSVDKGVQEALIAANGKERVPSKAKEEARKALSQISEKIPADFKNDALFAVDRDGRVIAQVGFDQANAFEDFELGGYAAVNDAIHGYLRDDTWVLGGKVYRVVTRPVEFDTTQPPAGAIVGIRAIDSKFAQELSRRTRTNVAFYSAGQRVASSASTEGFDESSFEQISGELGKLDGDKAYGENGRSEVKMIAENLGAMYARLVGEAWDLNAGFAVVRPRVAIAGPLGFLSGADDKDKASVPFALIGIAIVLAIGVGIALSFLEHSLPLKTFAQQAEGLRRGQSDLLQLPKFRGEYRTIASDINGGIERVAEKGGGAPRKTADLESILGPVPAQPAMSAFSFPLSDGGGAASVPSSPGGAAAIAPGAPSGQAAPASGISASPLSASTASPSAAALGAVPSSGMTPPVSAPQASALAVGAPPPRPGPPPPASPVASAAASPAPRVGPPAPPGPPAPTGPGAPPGPPPPPRPSGGGATQVGLGAQLGSGPSGFKPGGGMPSSPSVPSSPSSPSSPGGAALGAKPAAPPPRAPSQPSAPTPPPASPAANMVNGAGEEEDDDEATMVAAIPAEVLAQATGEFRAKAGEEAAEWLSVYEDFLRTKKQCGESTDGLTFDKFQHTLKKNRDALVQRHGCKKVKFSVYVKEGRASLKATPVKD